MKWELNPNEIMQIRKDTNRQLTKAEMDQLIRNIYLSIEEELEASAYYRALSEIAPDRLAAEMIREFSQDEREHAYALQQAYEALTGRNYSLPELEYEFEIDNYLEALEERVLAQTADFKKYKEYYLMTSNQFLRDIFFDAMHDEAYHAIRELYLIHMEMMRRMMMNNRTNMPEDMSEMRQMMRNIMNMMENMMEMMENMREEMHEMHQMMERNC
jgi:rubrerythrin